MSKIVTLTIEDAAAAVNEGSVVRVTGKTESGERIVFGVDTRVIVPVLQSLLLGDEDEVDVAIEDWQILRPDVWGYPPLSADEALDLMELLDKGSNLFGPLDSEIRARLYAVVSGPTQQTWDDAHSIIVAEFTTLWKAVIRHTDYGVIKHVNDTPWPMVPTTEQILTALREVLT